VSNAAQRWKALTLAAKEEYSTFSAKTAELGGSSPIQRRRVRRLGPRGMQVGKQRPSGPDGPKFQRFHVEQSELNQNPETKSARCPARADGYNFHLKVQASPGKEPPRCSGSGFFCTLYARLQRIVFGCSCDRRAGLMGHRKQRHHLGSTTD